jgi:hypothetical protein
MWQEVRVEGKPEDADGIPIKGFFSDEFYVSTAVKIHTVDSLANDTEQSGRWVSTFRRNILQYGGISINRVITRKTKNQMLLAEPANIRFIFIFLTRLSVSRLYSVVDRMINECGAVCGIKETKVLGENPPLCHSVHHKSLRT